MEPAGGTGVCRERNRLRREFLRTIHELNALHIQQIQAVIDDEPDFSRFDILLHMAQQQKELAKYALITHVESHNCERG